MTTSAPASSEASPIDSELGKDAIEHERKARDDGVEEEVEDETASDRARRLEKDDRTLRPQLQSTRSRSSARSIRSYRSHTEGYTRFNDGGDEERQNVDKNEEENGQEAGKEFEVTFDGDSDPYNPKNRPTGRKWLIVIIVSASSLCVTCASALYTSTYRQLEVEFHISRVVATLGLTTFVLG